MQPLVLVCVISIFATSWAIGNNVSVEYFINLINSKQTAWRAGKYLRENTTVKTVTFQVVDFAVGSQLYTKRKSCEVGSVKFPESFDARTQWPVCEDIIGKIRNQGSSDDCWAFASTEVMSDRLCIQTNGEEKFEFSAEDLVSCCKNCSADNGGWSDRAFHYWTKFGVVSGGDFTSNKGCKPYQESEYFYNKNSPCVETCYNDEYNISYNEDKHYGSEYYFVNKSQECIQVEIMENGPVVASLRLYEDFFYYKDGVYVYTVGGYTGMHSVKIVGWGIEKGLPYWLVANTWGCEWGSLNGFFKIRRGENECGIEGSVIAGNPLLEKSQTSSHNYSYVTWYIVSILIVFLAVILVVGVILHANKKLRTTSIISYLRLNH